MTAILDRATAATSTETTLADVIGYLASNATEADLDRVIDAVRARTRALQAVRAAAVSANSTVKLDNLTPKYLNGLTGTVQSIKGQRADVLLDEGSTTLLRFSGRRFYVTPDTKQYLLPGVPLSSCLTV